jgi:hypothetical protein
MKVIEVYVRSEEKLKGTADGDYSIYAEHPCDAKYNIIKTLCSSDKQALEILCDVAKEKSSAVKVYDVSTSWGKLKAFTKRIKIVPAIAIGSLKINGIPSREELLKALECT